MAQHTPGHWSYGKARDGSRRVFVDRDSIARVHAAHGARRLSDEERDANGRLLGASAKLLEALRLAESFMAGFEDDELQDGINERLKTIRSAIALAE